MLSAQFKEFIEAYYLNNVRINIEDLEDYLAAMYFSIYPLFDFCKICSLVIDLFFFLLLLILRRDWLLEAKICLMFHRIWNLLRIIEFFDNYQGLPFVLSACISYVVLKRNNHYRRYKTTVHFCRANMQVQKEIWF